MIPILLRLRSNILPKNLNNKFYANKDITPILSLRRNSMMGKPPTCGSCKQHHYQPGGLCSLGQYTACQTTESIPIWGNHPVSNTVHFLHLWWRVSIIRLSAKVTRMKQSLPLRAIWDTKYTAFWVYNKQKLHNILLHKFLELKEIQG